MLITTLNHTEKNLALHRWLLGVAGAIYMLWWFAVNTILPNDFNPIGSRVAVVAFIFAMLAISFAGPRARPCLPYFFYAAVWAITGHYFYLFVQNHGDINWIVGSYITVTAISLGLLTISSLLTYTVFVCFLLAIAMILVPNLNHSVFVPGLLTILIQANLALYARVRASRKAEEQKIRVLVMAENVRIRDEFISIASHELKTPLSTLTLQTQMMERDLELGKLKVEPREKLDLPMKIFKRQLHRMVEMVHAMLDVSRISSQGLTFNMQVLNFSKLVKETVLSVRTGMDGNIPVQIDCDLPSSLELRGDVARLTQVVENLLTNAIKYGNYKPIRVELKVDGKEAVLRVIDRGIGIRSEMTEKIFDRFERAVSARNISGLGLGLYISRNIVQAHGGRIEVQTELEQGSTFTVRLPC